MNKLIICSLLICNVIGYSQHDTIIRHNQISLSFEVMSSLIEDKNALLRLNLYYSHPLKENRLFYGLSIGYNNVGKNYYTPADYLDDAIITDYPDLITKPDTAGHFIGREIYGTYGRYIGSKFGLEKQLAQINLFYIEARAGISGGIQYLNTYQSIANYSIDSSNNDELNSPAYATYKREVINERYTTKRHVNFGIITSLKARYQEKKWGIWLSLNHDSGITYEISSKHTDQNSSYSNSFKDLKQTVLFETRLGWETGISFNF